MYICNEAEVWHQVSLENSNSSFPKRVLCQISPILINSEIWINNFVGNVELLLRRLAAFPVLHHTWLPCWAHRGLGLVQQRAGRHKTSEWHNRLIWCTVIWMCSSVADLLCELGVLTSFYKQQFLVESNTRASRGTAGISQDRQHTNSIKDKSCNTFINMLIANKIYSKS